MTLDGVSDHTKGIADEELHLHYSELIKTGDVILYGRITYQLMQFWQELLKSPSGEKSMDDFATSIDNIQKLVFTNTLQSTGWESAIIATRSLVDTVVELKKQPGKDILVGSRSLIIQLLNANLVDELHICIHPVIAGSGQLLFDQIADNIMLKLINIKALQSGATILYYEPVKA